MSADSPNPPAGVERSDGRPADALRPVSFRLDVQPAPPGSCLAAFGGTRVLCAVSAEDGAPRWRNHRGWVTGSYAMLPGSTAPRARRERTPRGRSEEIRRLIGRSLRAAVDLDGLPDITLRVDCDVIAADGGTRTAAVTGGWVALAQAMTVLELEDRLTGQVAAVSVGVVDRRAVLDLPYAEDMVAEVDMNVVATAAGRLVEVQGTAEGQPFDRGMLDRLMDLALDGCRRLCDLQEAALVGNGPVGENHGR